MSNSSQSGHFNQRLSVHWLDRSQTWLEQLDPLISTSWSWLVSHHQLLTLAKRAERQVGLSILWFTVVDESKHPLVFGALLPQDRVALVNGSPYSSKDMAAYLRGKMKLKSVMGTQGDLTKLGFVEENLDPDEVIECQLSWGKRLATVSAEAVVPKNPREEDAISTRRAAEADRTLLNRWAKIFANETGANVEGTTLEVFEWMKRGKLLIFETTAPGSRPVAMAALSGEHTDRKFGRSCRLSLLFTDPAYRGRGYGRLAVEAIEHEARLENANGLVLYSESKNERITRFYSGLGFQLSDEWLEVEAGFNVSTTG